jgi:hypothetical protein
MVFKGEDGNSLYSSFNIKMNISLASRVYGTISGHCWTTDSWWGRGGVGWGEEGTWKRDEARWVNSVGEETGLIVWGRSHAWTEWCKCKVRWKHHVERCKVLSSKGEKKIQQELGIKKNWIHFWDTSFKHNTLKGRNTWDTSTLNPNKIKINEKKAKEKQNNCKGNAANIVKRTLSLNLVSLFPSTFTYTSITRTGSNQNVKKGAVTNEHVSMRFLCYSRSQF